MIVTEEYMTLRSGKKLYKTYSDRKVMIMQHPLGVIYAEAVDVEGAPYIYTETDIPLEMNE